jgi:hypothetical protein
MHVKLHQDCSGIKATIGFAGILTTGNLSCLICKLVEKVILERNKDSLQQNNAFW